MTSDDVQGLVNREIDEWRAPIVEPGTTVGVPWDASRYLPYIDELRRALVQPYVQRFVLAETYEHVTAAEKSEASYWVVAVANDDLLWFDESTGEFGLATRASDGLPTSIGVRGDIVGSFSSR
jgi:hypothetical protein